MTVRSDGLAVLWQNERVNSVNEIDSRMAWQSHIQCLAKSSIALDGLSRPDDSILVSFSNDPPR